MRVDMRRPPMKPDLPPYEVLLTLVVLYSAEKVVWYDDDTVVAEVRIAGKDQIKTYAVSLDHLAALEQKKFLKLYDDCGKHGTVMLTGRGRRTAKNTVDYYQLELV